MTFSKKSILPFLSVALFVILLLLKSQIITLNSKAELQFNTESEIMPQSKLDSLNERIEIQRDKLNSLESLRDFKVSGFKGFWYFFSTFVGVYQLYEQNMYAPSKIHYLSLPSVKLKLVADLKCRNYLQYYYKDGQGFITKAKYKKSQTGGIKMYRVDKEVNFRYSPYSNTILIPIESDFWINSVYAFLFIFYILYGATFLFLIFNFIAFLIDISRNMAFDKVNILRLKHMSIFGFIISLIPLLINACTYLFFTANYLNEDIEMGYDFWSYDFYVLIFSITIFLFYTAFNSGMKIKQENDLTI